MRFFSHFFNIYNKLNIIRDNYAHNKQSNVRIFKCCSGTVINILPRQYLVLFLIKSRPKLWCFSLLIPTYKCRSNFADCHIRIDFNQPWGGGLQGEKNMCNGGKMRFGHIRVRLLQFVFYLIQFAGITLFMVFACLL